MVGSNKRSDNVLKGIITNYTNKRISRTKMKKMDYVQSKKYRVHSQPIPNEPEIKKGTAEAVLKVFGKWAGDDSEEIIDLIYSTRSKAEF